MKLISIKEKIEKEYNYSVNNIEKNDESTDGNVYIIYADNKKYVAKIYNELKHTKDMINLHYLLIKNRLNVPKIQDTINNKKYVQIANDRYLVLYSFIEGKQIEWYSKHCNLNFVIIEQMAVMLRKLHIITNSNKIKLEYVPYINKDTKLYESILHFDLTRNNILVGKESIELIDFDDAKYGPSICDISNLIANVFFSKKYGVDLDGVNIFINKYYENLQERKNKELPLIKEYAIKWINYILEENEFDSSKTESFIIKRGLIEKYL